ncbi:MAG: glycosyltransferase family 4 protein [Chloroflexota bacterium]
MTTAKINTAKTDTANTSTANTNEIKVLQLITRLIIGGAQETVYLTADRLRNEWDLDVISGPQTGVEGSLIPIIEECGIALSIEPSLVREIHPYKDVLALWRLTQIMRREKYQIVHTNSSKAGIVGRWAAKLAGVPIIVHTVHGWGHHERQHPLIRAFYIWLEKRTLTVTDKLIVVTPKDIADGLQDGIGTEDDYVLIRSGIELERFGHPQVSPPEMRQLLGIPQDAPVVGSVTRLSPQKGPLDFVQMAARIAQTHPDTHFVMVGDGPLRGDVEALIAQHGLTAQFHLTGLRRDVPELLATFDIFVLTSLWEGLPRVLPQAMATGLPIVATAIDGNAEAVEDGVNGFLVPPENPTALSQSVCQLLDDDALAQRMGQAGLARVEEFGAQRMVDQVSALYRALLQQQGGL